MDNLIMGIAVLLAALLSLRLGITVAIFEIAAGAIAGNYLGVRSTDWLVHFAEFGSLLLIFLAGSDIAFLQRRLKPVGAIGSISFLAPLLAVLLYGLTITHWNRDQLLLISIACSSTSVAIVYPVLRDSGVLKVELGKLLLLIAFLPDFLITVALFVFFTSIGLKTLVVVALLMIAIVGLRFTSMRFLKRYGETSSEVKLRFIFKKNNVSLSQETSMKLTGKAKMLRIHIGEDDELNGEPLYEAIIKKAREMDIAGATAYRGIEGYGAHKRFHKQKLLALSADLPMLITIIDTEENIKRFLAVLDTMVTGGCLIALSDVDVIKYTHHSDEKTS